MISRIIDRGIPESAIVPTSATQGEVDELDTSTNFQPQAWESAVVRWWNLSAATARGNRLPADASVEDQMRAVEASGTLDFWADEEEDQYDETDGDAV